MKPLELEQMALNAHKRLVEIHERLAAICEERLASVAKAGKDIEEILMERLVLYGGLAELHLLGSVYNGKFRSVNNVVSLKFHDITLRFIGKMISDGNIFVEKRIRGEMTFHRMARRFSSWAVRSHASDVEKMEAEQERAKKHPEPNGIKKGGNGEETHRSRFSFFSRRLRVLERGRAGDPDQRMETGSLPPKVVEQKG